MSILSCDGVTLCFGGLTAVSDFNFRLEEKEIVSLIGPNGAGKTSVFNTITGIYPLNKGSIRFRSTMIGGMRPSQIAGMGLTRTFQNIRLFKDLTVLDNVRTAFHLGHPYGLLGAIFRTPRYWMEEDLIRKKAIDLLNVFDLRGRMNVAAKHLPYGEQRELEIVRALATQPRVLLLDEPAAGMNHQETDDLMKTIRRIRDQFSLSILLIEHDMKMVMDVSDRIIVLDHGQTIAQGTPHEVRNNPRVIDAYLGSVNENGNGNGNGTHS